VFFDDAVLPIENLVGAPGDGWRIANGTLGHERMLLWILEASATMRRVDELVSRLNHGAVQFDDITRDAVARHYVDAFALTCIGYRGMAKINRGLDAPEHSLLKLYGAETTQAMELTALEMAGFEGVLDEDADALIADGFTPRPPPFLSYYGTFANTIAGGTSEIQRNIIAQRVLGLPR
jgi:alkylation response protein AidB-like acyl-CoA dehydrogenase